MKALLTVLLTGLVACDKSMEEIEQQRSLWLANAPREYSYTVQVSGWRSPRELLHPKRVTVQDNGVAAEYLWDGAGYRVGETAMSARIGRS
jgi:hypothetical protein